MRLRGLHLSEEEVEKERERQRQEQEKARETERQKYLRRAGDIPLKDIALLELPISALLELSHDNIRKENRNSTELSVERVKIKEGDQIDNIQQESPYTLYSRFEPNEIRITPERIFCVTFHPFADRQIIYAGDKAGNMGLWAVDDHDNISSLLKVTSRIENSNWQDSKVEDNESSLNAETGDQVNNAKVASSPTIFQFKLHSRTITSLATSSADADTLLTSSYDNSVRKFNLAKEVSTEVFYVGYDEMSGSISSIDLNSDGNRLLCSTVGGEIIIKDLRDGKPLTKTLHERKIGTVSTSEANEQLICTASLDRTLKIWDLRMIKEKKSCVERFVSEYQCNLSISSAFWNLKGDIVTTSYDDYLRVFTDAGKMSTLEPTYAVRHNNQTGRWVTVFKARWQQSPSDGKEKIIVGNMNRAIDIFDEQCVELDQVYDAEKITAIPAVTTFHPSRNWIAAGTASGKIVSCLS